MIEEFLAMRYLSQCQYKSTLRKFLSSTHGGELKYNSYKRSCWMKFRELNHINSKRIIHIVLVSAIGRKTTLRIRHTQLYIYDLCRRMFF